MQYSSNAALQFAGLHCVKRGVKSSTGLEIGQLPVWMDRYKINLAISSATLTGVKAVTGSGKTVCLNRIAQQFTGGSTLTVVKNRLAAINAFEYFQKAGLNESGREVMARYGKVEADGEEDHSCPGEFGATHCYITIGVLVRWLLNYGAYGTFKNFGAVILDEAQGREPEFQWVLHQLHTAMADARMLRAVDEGKFRVVYTSATMNSEDLMEYFDEHSAEEVVVEGRAFSQYWEVVAGESLDDDATIAAACRLALARQSQVDGPIILFLAGKPEIEKAQEHIGNARQNVRKK